MLMICLMHGKKKRLLLLGGLFFLNTLIFSETYTLSNIYTDRLVIVEKKNTARTENNIYKGWLFNQVKIILNNTNSSNLPLYSGSSYYYEELVRENRLLPNRIDTVYPVKYRPGQSYYSPVQEISRFPRLQNFPYFSSDALRIGDKWTAYGIMIVDPLRNGLITRLKTLTEYQFHGLTEYIGRPAFLVTAKFATRYRQGEDPYGDNNLSNASGTHDIFLYVYTDKRGGYFFRDTYEEIFTYSNKDTVHERGSVLHWGNTVVQFNRSETISNINRQKEELGLEELIVTETDYGLSISLDFLYFHPDQATLLPGQQDILINVFEILKAHTDRSILIVGHTADVGTQESQIDLSVQRAEAVAHILKGFGFPADKLLFRGVGGTQPVAPNTTESNRAKNRRVEFIFLED